MNKMKRIYGVWGVIVIGIFVLLTTFGFMYKNKSKDYKALEQKLVTAEKKYVDAKFLYPTDNQELKVTAETLKENGYLDSLEINGENCDGYATIKKKNAVFEYNGYISCKNYKSKGYN